MIETYICSFKSLGFYKNSVTVNKLSSTNSPPPHPQRNKLVQIILHSINACLTVFFSRDRFRTAINVLGDTIGAGIVDHLSQDDLKLMDRLESDGEGIQDNDVSMTTESSGISSKENGVTYQFEEKKSIDMGLNNPAFANGDVNTPL